MFAKQQTRGTALSSKWANIYGGNDMVTLLGCEACTTKLVCEACTTGGCGLNGTIDTPCLPSLSVSPNAMLDKLIDKESRTLGSTASGYYIFF